MRHVPSTAVLFFSTCLSVVAHANGTTLMPGGVASVSRGGAVAARPEDATAIVTNPAALAFIPGGQIYVGADTPFQKMCVAPYGYYGWGDAKSTSSGFGPQNDTSTGNPPGYAVTPLSPVCNSAGTFPVPQLAAQGHITKDLAYGIGFLNPVLVPGQQFGGDDGTVQTPYGPRPTPTRGTLIKQTAVYASDPSFSLAYRFMSELAAGMTLQITSIAARQSQVQVPPGSGTSPSSAILSTVYTQDLFIPALTFSVHAKPIPGLDVMGAFKWSDDLHGSGDVVFETNTYNRPYQGISAQYQYVPYKNAPVRLSDVTVRLPWAATGAIRYAGLLKDDKAPGGDPMATERWDVEFDFNYTFDARTSNSSVTLGQDATLLYQKATGGTEQSTVKASDLGTLTFDRHLRDNYALRVGGSYSVLPRKFAVNAGVFYESPGVDLAYANVGAFSFQRIGASIGIMARFGSWDLRVGATQIRSETVEVAPPPNQSQAVGATVTSPTTGNPIGSKILPDPNAPPPSKADAVAAQTQFAHTPQGVTNWVVNAGRYTASFEVLSVGATFHF
ncbi:MAG TPA: hypothetical protein VHC69_22695 [Polyangiaceae bacterium]|nr:hypothetical protein [Polyangiaceae bacterium]